MHRSLRVSAASFRSWRPAARSLILVLAALPLAACGSRDTELAETVARAEAAARRAETAANAIEQKLRNARLAGQVAFAEDGSAEGEGAAEDESANQNPDSPLFDNTIAAPPAAPGA